MWRKHCFRTLPRACYKFGSKHTILNNRGKKLSFLNNFHWTRPGKSVFPKVVRENITTAVDKTCFGATNFTDRNILRKSSNPPWLILLSKRDDQIRFHLKFSYSGLSEAQEMLSEKWQTSELWMQVKYFRSKKPLPALPKLSTVLHMQASSPSYSSSSEQ